MEKEVEEFQRCQNEQFLYYYSSRPSLLLLSIICIRSVLPVWMRNVYPKAGVCESSCVCCWALVHSLVNSLFVKCVCVCVIRLFINSVILHPAKVRALTRLMSFSNYLFKSFDLRKRRASNSSAFESTVLHYSPAPGNFLEVCLCCEAHFRLLTGSGPAISRMAELVIALLNRCSCGFRAISVSTRWISPSRFGRVSPRGLWDTQPAVISGTVIRSAGATHPNGPTITPWSWPVPPFTTGTHLTVHVSPELTCIFTE